MNITLILRGGLRRRRQLEGELRRLRRSLPRAAIEVLESGHAGHARQLAADNAGHSDYIIAVGGDGTLNEVLNGCLDSTSPLPCLGVLAHGTANDMLRSLDMRGTAEELAALLDSRSERCIDIGRVSCVDASGAPLQRYFANIADVGIGAEVVQHLVHRHRLLGSNLNYLLAILKTFSHYRKKPLRVSADGEFLWQGPALALVAANGCYFGSGLCVAPRAALDDGQLALTLVGDASVADFALNLPRLRRGALLEHPEASYHRAQSLELQSPEEPTPLEVDGEFLGFTPAAIEILPRRLRLLAPGGPA